jgi:hypothetical protein
MGRPKKKPHEMTTEQAMVRLFGKKGHALLKETARKLDEEKPNSRRGKKPVE